MTDFSPITQAVWNAAYNTPEDCPYEHDLAAALEAAADQVVPERAKAIKGGCTYEQAYSAAVHYDIRNRLLAIAAELRGNTEDNQ